MTTPDGRVWFLTSSTSYVIKAGPKLEVLAKNELGGYSGNNGPSPAIANGRIYVRDTAPAGAGAGVPLLHRQKVSQSMHRARCPLRRLILHCLASCGEVQNAEITIWSMPMVKSSPACRISEASLRIKFPSFWASVSFIIVLGDDSQTRIWWSI